MKETSIAAAAWAWLEGLGYVCYSEVVARGKRIDLVGRLAHSIVAVECKTSLGLSVIGQANQWVGEASESWICVPGTTRRQHRYLGERLCADLGIGVLYADVAYPWRPDGERWKVAVQARRCDPKRLAMWEKRLHEEQRTAAPAGSNGGGYVTKFSLTCAALVAYVATHPDCELGIALKAIDHHYNRHASAVHNMSELMNRVGPIRPGALSRIRIEGKGAKARLWPTEDVF